MDFEVRAEAHVRPRHGLRSSIRGTPLSDAERAALRAKAAYEGCPHHERNPGDFGLIPPAAPRPDKTLCDEARIHQRAMADALFATAIDRGLVSEANTPDGFPKQLWVVDDNDQVFEAMQAVERFIDAVEARLVVRVPEERELLELRDELRTELAPELQGGLAGADVIISALRNSQTTVDLKWAASTRAPVSANELPWQRGARVARELRQRMSIRSGPLSKDAFEPSDLSCRRSSITERFRAAGCRYSSIGSPSWMRTCAARRWSSWAKRGGMSCSGVRNQRTFSPRLQASWTSDAPMREDSLPRTLLSHLNAGILDWGGLS
jgi:hypothetical protein